MDSKYSVLESTQLFLQNYELYENPPETARTLYGRLFSDKRIDIVKRQTLGNQLRKILKMYKDK